MLGAEGVAREMLETYTVSFFGHRHVDNMLAVEDKLERIIRKLLHRSEYIEFLVGRDGEFDQLVASTVRRCRRAVRKDNSALVWVQAYPTAEYLNNEESFHSYYDEIEICEAASAAHFKRAIQIRNRSMIDRSDLVVFFVERESGGAWQTMQYAKKQDAVFILLQEAVEISE